MQRSKTMQIVAILLIVVGGLFLVGGIVGVIEMSSTGYDSEFIDLGLQLGAAIGVTSLLSPGQRLMLFVVRCRVMLIVLGLLFVGGGVAMEWYMHSPAHRKSAAAAPQYRPAPQYYAPPRSPAGAPASRSNQPESRLLMCESGELAGKTFRLTTTTSIGRDPARCKILYPVDARGVSRLHATVTFQGGVVRVTDENSSYGTWLDDTRLTPGYPQRMHRGQRLYLGSRRQVFRLC